MSARLICYLLLIHFLADFMLQPREMAKKKSTEFMWLAKHVLIINWCFAIGLLAFGFPIHTAFFFAGVNAAIHGVIDWHIWKVYKLCVTYTIYQTLRKLGLEVTVARLKEQGKAFPYWEDKWFYHTIGLDQLLHGLTLILVMNWLL